MFYVKSMRKITKSQSGWLQQSCRTENLIFWMQKKELVFGQSESVAYHPLPAVFTLLKSRLISLIVKSTWKGAICSLRINKCLIWNNSPSSGLCNTNTNKLLPGWNEIHETAGKHTLMWEKRNKYRITYLIVKYFVKHNRQKWKKKKQF